MQEPRRLAAILAHPDDETLGFGGLLARYASQGVETYLLTATRGQRGLAGAMDLETECEDLGCIREGELRAAAKVLGLRQVEILEYVDGEFDQADPQIVIGEIASFLRHVRPQVVLTFDPFGVYGHPDHIAISQFVTAGIVAAASPDDVDPDEPVPHQVSKLYYRVDTSQSLDLYQQAFGELVMKVDGSERSVVGWPEWAITTRIDTASYAAQVWRAAACHASQVGGDPQTWSRLQKDYPHLFDRYALYRTFSLVNGGRGVERDLFEGIQNS